MSTRWITLAGITSLFFIVYSHAEAPIDSPEKKLSYALGMALGEKLHSESVQLDAELYMQGLNDALRGGPTRMSDKEIRGVIQDFQRDLRMKRTAAYSEQLKRNQAKVVQDTVLTDIRVTFKMDPRLTHGLYMGERWVSPTTFTSTRREDGESIFEAKAEGFTGQRRKLPVSADWIPSEPDMVRVTSTGDGIVRIAVLQPGRSSLKVVADGVTRTLQIHASNNGDGILVKVTQ